ncbi:MAG: disulfide bond formation protein B [Robiginitomaculum sp.]|nr:disulfide bond formation protein B [Robiginitomaculum sp.]
MFFRTSFWPVLAAIASLGALGIAHAFETFGGLQPCALCLRQREVYWFALTIAILGILVMRFKPEWRLGRGVVALLGLTFLTGAMVAGYHAGVEWHFWPGPTTCSGGGSGLDGLSASDLSAVLGTAAKAPACDKIPWSFAGISMAGWNMLLSLALAGASFFSLVQGKEREIAP